MNYLERASPGAASELQHWRQRGPVRRFRLPAGITEADEFHDHPWPSAGDMPSPVDASARAVRNGWALSEDRGWVWSGVEPGVWEVVCPACGDDGGPAETQAPQIRALRGHYWNRYDAAAAAVIHNREQH